MEKIVKKIGFTLVEILITVSIMLIISSSGMVYFSNFISETSSAQEKILAENFVKKLDNNVFVKNTLDYELDIKLGAYLYTYTNNKIGKENYIYFDSLDIKTGSSILKTNISNTGSILQIKNYANNKLIDEVIIDATESYIYDFSGYEQYKIKSYLNGREINELNLNYISETNLEDNHNFLEVILINTQFNKSGTNYSSLLVKNINNKKIILGNGNIDLNKIFVFYERNGKEFTLAIKK